LCLCHGLHLYVQFICVESIAGGDGRLSNLPMNFGFNRLGQPLG
jgi:hypothetical protein